METEVLSLGGEIVGTVVDALKGFATGVTGTIVDVFNNVVTTSTGGLSNLAIWGLVTGAVALGTGLIMHFVRKAG